MSEPDSAPMPLILLVVGAGVFILLGLILARVGTGLTPRLELPRFILTLLLLFPLHELIHAVMCPGQGLSSRTTLGVWPARGIFYVFHDGPMTRKRHLLVLAAPFVALSVAPLLVIVLAPTLLPPPAMVSMSLISLFNGAASAGDVLSFYVIATQVPAAALVRSQGTHLYWRRQPAP